MPQPDTPAPNHLPGPVPDDFLASDPDPPEHGASLLADLVAASLAAVITALALLIACGWLTTLWGAVLLGALLICPLVLVLVVLMRQ